MSDFTTRQLAIFYAGLYLQAAYHIAFTCVSLLVLAGICEMLTTGSYAGTLSFSQRLYQNLTAH